MVSVIDKKKYNNAVLYFIKYCNNAYLGRTKLNKLLYYLDFISYRDREKTITGDSYISKSYGPVPEKIDEVITELHTNKLIDIKKVPYKDSDKIEFTLRSEPDISIFDNYEQTLLDKICNEFCTWSTDKIVEQTHLEAPWFYSDLFSMVDFNYAKDLDFFK